MLLSRFAERAKDYGVRRLLTDSDVKAALGIWVSTFLISYGCTPFVDGKCHTLYNRDFISQATTFSISLTSLILIGLSILVAFTNREFLSELKNLGIYENIMFVFEYTFYLTAFTSIFGIVITSYSLGVVWFYLFLLLFIYMVFSVLSLIQLVVEFGNQKARYESKNS